MTDKRLVKLAGKVLGNPKDVAFYDLRRLLEGFGFVCKSPSGGSSHFVFRKPGSMPISVPKDRPVNTAYVKQVIRLLDLEGWHEDQNR